MSVCLTDWLSYNLITLQLQLLPGLGKASCSIENIYFIETVSDISTVLSIIIIINMIIIKMINFKSLENFYQLVRRVKQWRKTVARTGSRRTGPSVSGTEKYFSFPREKMTSPLLSPELVRTTPSPRGRGWWRGRRRGWRGCPRPACCGCSSGHSSTPGRSPRWCWASRLSSRPGTPPAAGRLGRDISRLGNIYASSLMP